MILVMVVMGNGFVNSLAGEIIKNGGKRFRIL